LVPLRQGEPDSPHVFMTERKGPLTPSAARKIVLPALFLVVPSSAYPKASSYKFVSAGINHKIAGI